MIDTGCSYGTSSGESQFLAYWQYTGYHPKIRETSNSTVRFGKGSSKSKGTALLRIPFGSTIFEVDVHILPDTDVPILLSLQDMDSLGIYFDNLTNRLHHKVSNEYESIERFYGHPFYKWSNMMQCFYTESELRRLHRRFGHPGTDKLFNLLKEADVQAVSPKTRASLEEIAKHCKLCQLHGQRPRRFRFTLRSKKGFNQSVFIDIMFIDGKPLLHVVCETTRYQSAQWLPKDTNNIPARLFLLCTKRH